MAEAASTGPASPFPEGDPRNAKYFENLAALEHSKGRTEAEDAKGREEAASTYKYGTEQLQKQEPLALKANTNRANTEGLATSGILAQRQGVTQTGYAGKEHTLGESRRTAVERFNRGDQLAREGYAEKAKSALTNAEIEARANLEKNPPAAQPPALGYTPGEYGGKGQGFVRVGPKPESGIKWSRNAAVRKVQEQRGY
jgi:hypothetical protein